MSTSDLIKRLERDFPPNQAGALAEELEALSSEEINFLAEGKRGRTPVLIVGEAKSRLAAHNLTSLKKKVKEVEQHYPLAAGREIVPIMVVHSARPKELQRAGCEGVIVVQSFEW